MEVKTTQNGNTLIMELQSERLDVQSVPAFKAATADLIQPGGNIVIDLHAVQFVDSSGLGALLSLLRRAKEVDGQLVLARASEQTLAMFRLVRMTRIFDLYPTLDEALEAMNG